MRRFAFAAGSVWLLFFSVALASAQERAPAIVLGEDDDFAQGSWIFQTYAGGTFLSDRGSLGHVHAGVGYHLFDGLSLNLEGVGVYIWSSDHGSETGSDTFGGGLDVLLRWHFLRGRGWSLYADGGAGMLQTDESFPANGAHFNFTPQFGFGGTLRLADRLRLMGGARWHHISNAGIGGENRNPGYDGLMVYGGVMVPF